MKLLLSFILMIISNAAQDDWQEQHYNPSNQYTQQHETPPQPPHHSLLPQAALFIFVGVATPVLAYVGVKAGTSVWFQSTGLAQSIQTAISSFVSFYPNAPRNIFALLLSWGICSTVGLIQASKLKLNLYFLETDR